MKILYLAKFGEHDNSDEMAIAHAFEVLGHTVVKVEENPGKRPVGTNLSRTAEGCDFCLFHKYDNVSELASIPIPKVGWYFDLVAGRCPTLASRMMVRQSWFRDVLPHCTLMFCTDGDWVNQDETGKLRWLMQGADERKVVERIVTKDPAYEILFTGMIHHGRSRAEHVGELKARYGDRFTVMGDSGPRYRVHGRGLADVFSATKVVVAPDGPHTDSYWSNRVYLTLGLGGFLLHPFCKGLSSHYTPWRHLQYYDNREHLVDLIEDYLQKPSLRLQLQEAGLARTKERNLYRHRVEDMLRMIKNAQEGKPSYV